MSFNVSFIAIPWEGLNYNDFNGNTKNLCCFHLEGTIHVVGMMGVVRLSFMPNLVQLSNTGALQILVNDGIFLRRAKHMQKLQMCLSFTHLIWANVAYLVNRCRISLNPYLRFVVPF